MIARRAGACPDAGSAGGRRRAQQLGATARSVAQAAPETLTVVRYRAQPAALAIARLTSTAVFAYLVALELPGAGTSRPVLAPLTALLVVQVTLYQTLRSAVRRVAAVVTGVLVAIVLSDVVGFTWWSPGLTIMAALVLGLLLAADPAQRPVGWPLRGELVSPIDRLRHQLEPGSALRLRRERIRSWRVPPLLSRLQQRLPSQTRK